MRDAGLPAATVTILKAMRDDGMLHVLPSLQGEAREHAGYALQMLGRLCTNADASAVDAALQRDAAALFATLDRELGEAPPSDATSDLAADDAAPVQLQQALLWRLHRLSARTDADARLWQDCAQLAAQLRTAIEARQAPVPAPDTASTIDRTTLAQLLRERWPDHPQLDVLELRVLPGGRSKTTMLARLGGHPDFEDFALRQDVPNGMIDTADGSTCVAAEYPLLRAAFAAKLPVAEPLWLEADENPLGAPFMITRLCPGETPGSWRGFHAPDADTTRDAVLHLADVLAALHRVPLSATGLADGLSTEVRMQREIAYRRDKWRRDAPAPYPLIDCALERLRRECIHGLGAAVLVHGDVLPHNLLVADGRITALLDWEFAHAGDPAEDLAYCRAAVEAVVPWPTFLARYHAAGGPPVSERRLAIYGLFGLVRNSSLLASAAHLHAEGRITDFTTAAIGHLSLPMMELLIAQQLQRLDSIDPAGASR